MKTFVLSLLAITFLNSASAITVLPPRQSAGAAMGKAFADGFNEAFTNEMNHQRNLRHQREQMELLREQIRWEMEQQYGR